MGRALHEGGQEEGFWTCFSTYLTSIHNFSAIIQKKYFIAKEVPPFHLGVVMHLAFSALDKVELWVEYRWNYMKFHPNSTHNSTLHKPLIIKTVTLPRWNGGITNKKKYFFRKRVRKVLTTVKNRTKQVITS